MSKSEFQEWLLEEFKQVEGFEQYLIDNSYIEDVIDWIA